VSGFVGTVLFVDEDEFAGRTRLEQIPFLPCPMRKLPLQSVTALMLFKNWKVNKGGNSMLTISSRVCGSHRHSWADK
jgi:hypothetical protein